MLKSLEYYAKEDPVGAELIEISFYKEAAKKAGVTVKKLMAAIDRVYADGYYGPISKKDWIEQDGRKNVADIKVALKIVHDAMQYVPRDIEYFTSAWEWYEDENGDALPNDTLKGNEVYKDVWKFYYEIYGG